MANKRPLILVTNDDGITAPGIRALIQIMNTIGDVVVVAPDRPQSGMGHAITVDNVLHCNPITIDDGPQIEYSCSGTPADCVKMAINEILNRKPDLCVSGINHGANSSINVIYSGTMSAAVEAGIEGVPAIGFSLLDFNYKADFNQGKQFVKTGKPYKLMFKPKVNITNTSGLIYFNVADAVKANGQKVILKIQ